MSDVKLEDDHKSSLTTSVNISKECNLQFIQDKKDIEKSAFQNEKFLEAENHSMNPAESTSDAMMIVQSTKGIVTSKKVKTAMSIKKKRTQKSANGVKKSEKSDLKAASLNDSSVEFSESLSCSSSDTSKFLLFCQFCRTKFESSELMSIHECNLKDSNFNDKVHKCEFCSSTFSQKHKLDRHMKGHYRNNCTRCNAQFTKRKALCKHLKFEHNIREPEKFYPCSFCSKNFGNKSSLNTHLKSHANGQYFCLKCGFMCDKEDQYNDHVKEHIENSKYECNLCGKKFVRRQQHDQHMMGHERHFCSPCNITFSTKKLLSKHKQSEHGARISVKKHECPICKKLFLRPKHLQTHQRIHTGESQAEKPVKCSHCEKFFCDQRALSKHMKTVKHLQRVYIDEGKVIEIEKPFLCSVCGARFYRKQSLFRHVEMKHSASESYKCPHCDYNTKCKTNLKRHVELHTDTKRFICEICGSSFRAFASLKEHHVFVHSENRGFICNVCKKAFKNKSTLLRHLRIHSEVRPYKCYCDRDYKRMSHLKRHMISAHHMIFQKNRIPVISESTNIHSFHPNENLASALESLETLQGESSCDDFPLITVPHKDTVCVELNNSSISKDTNEGCTLTLAEGDNLKNVPSNTLQTLLDKSISDEDSKNTLMTLPSDACIATSPMGIPPDPDTSSSMSLDDPNLNLSPNNFCNFNLPSSPLSSIPIENETTTLVNSIASQDVLSFPSSSDSLIRPHSLPNLNFQTSITSMDSFTPFSLHSSDSPPPLQIPSFLLNGDISSEHESDLNLGQNNSTKQLFGDSDDILSLQSYTSNNQLSGVNCSSDQLFSPAADIELWDNSDNSNTLKIPDGELVTTSSCASFSTHLTSNTCNLLAHSILSSNDSLIVYPLDSMSLNPEYDALSNLC